MNKLADALLFAGAIVLFTVSALGNVLRGRPAFNTDDDPMEGLRPDHDEEELKAERAGYAAPDHAPCPYVERRLVQAFWRGREAKREWETWAY